MAGGTVARLTVHHILLAEGPLLGVYKPGRVPAALVPRKVAGGADTASIGEEGRAGPGEGGGGEGR